MLSCFGPAEQLHGGSRLISASSFWMRLAEEESWEPFMVPLCTNGKLYEVLYNRLTILKAP